MFYNFLLLVNNIYGDDMRIRLGYACICNGIDGTSSTNYTYSEFSKSRDLDKLDRVIISNLEILEEIINGSDVYVKAVTDPEMIVILTRILKSQM